MIIEEALVSRLIAQVPLVGGRVYPMLLPPSVTLPAITYQKISSVRAYTHDGFAHYAEPRFQVSAWATTYAGAKAIQTQVKTALEAYVGMMGGGVDVQRCLVANEIDLYDPESRIYHQAVDYILAHAE